MPDYSLDSQNDIPWDVLLRFFRRRELPNVERISRTHYLRAGVTVTRGDPRRLLVQGPQTKEIVERLRHMFDLDANHAEISAHLGMSPVFLPGAWSGFELAVRAVLGQQITVAAARTLAGRLAARMEITPENLRAASLDGLGILPSRVRTLRALAERAQAGVFGYFPEELLSLPGIGPWTAEYIGMRVRRDPDAFPAGDLILRRAAIPGQVLTERALKAHAERWRPYRAYAAVALWGSV